MRDSEWLQKIGARIMELRTQNDYTRQDVKNLTGIATSTLYNYEYGITQMSLKHLKKLAELYKCDLKDFF